MVFLGIEALHTEQRKILRAAWWDRVKEGASVAGLAHLNGGVIPWAALITSPRSR